MKKLVVAMDLEDFRKVAPNFITKVKSNVPARSGETIGVSGGGPAGGGMS